MKEYNITNVQRRDEWQGRFGPMVTFAVALEGEQGWIKLNQKLETPEPKVGDTLTGIIENKTTTNGEAYRGFKKINPAYADKPQQQSQASPQMDYIVMMLEELTGRRELADPVPKLGELEDPFPDI